MKPPGEDEAGVVVHDGDQVVVAPAHHPEVGGVGGPHLVGSGGLPVVLLPRCESHLRPLHQSLPPQDAVDRGLRHREPHVVGDPRGQLSWTQLRHLPRRRQNVVDFQRGQSVPWGLASSRIIIQSSLLTPPQPPVVGAPGHSKLTERLAFGESRGCDPGQHLTLLHGAHPLVPVSSWGIGIAVFLRRYPSRDSSATSCFSSTFSRLSP